MIRIRLAAAGAASLALAALPSCALPKGQFVVINNTNQALDCAYKPPGDGARWKGWTRVPAAGNWRFASPAEVSVQCAAPVKRRIYELEPGERYSLVRARDGSVDLVRVTA